MFSNKNIKDEKLSKKNLLKYVSEYDIYAYYIGEFTIGSIFSSPFREDDNPSFGIFIGHYGDLAYNDFKLGGGDCFSFIMKMENVTFYESLSIVNNIFKVGLIDFSNSNTKEIKTPIITSYKVPLIKYKPKISIKIRDWNQDDTDYFKPLNLDKLTCLPIQYFWIDEQIFNTDKLAYAWRYGINIYKIYQPNLDTKKGKWWSNISIKNNWFGHDGLHYDQDTLFICSSNKDASVLHQLDYNAIAPHTEAQMFSQEQYDYYSSKFSRIIIFYDNDETGILKASKFSEKWGFDYIYLPEEETKDPFEFIKQYSMEELKEFIEEYI